MKEARSTTLCLLSMLLCLSGAQAWDGVESRVEIGPQEATSQFPGRPLPKADWWVKNSGDRPFTGITLGFGWFAPVNKVVAQRIRISPPLAPGAERQMAAALLKWPEYFAGVVCVLAADWSRGVEVNGRAVACDVAPIERSGRTFIAIADVARALGATVEWIAESRAVMIGREGHTIRLVIGARRATVDGKNLGLDVAPFIESGRTMMPLRFVAEQFGAKVDFVKEQNLVRITS